MTKEVAASVPSLTLRGTDDKFPVVGLGTWKAPAGQVKEAVINAIRIGYRHIDCACDYGNEHEVGEAIAQVIAEGTVTRQELFVTSKLWNTYHAKQHVEPALRKTLADLRLDYVDLYLIHFPISLKFVPFEERYPPEWIHDPKGPNPRMEFEDVPIHETWAGMEGVVDKGLARNIGISNFAAQSVMDLLKYARIKPAVIQIELHPYLVQESLVWFCQKEGIHVTGFSPLGSSSYIQLGMDQGQGVGVLNDPAIAEIAKKYNKSPAQVVLRWATQRNISVIPKSTHTERLEQNIKIFDFQLSPEDCAKIAKLDRHLRYNDPGEFCKGMGGSYPIYA